MKRTTMGERLRPRLSELRDAVNWKAVLIIGMAISFLLCLSHAYRFMKQIGL